MGCLYDFASTPVGEAVYRGNDRLSVILDPPGHALPAPDEAAVNRFASQGHILRKFVDIRTCAKGSTGTSQNNCPDMLLFLDLIECVHDRID
jgi:hypothetical protein